MEEEKEVTSTNPSPEPAPDKRDTLPSQFKVQDDSSADRLQSILARCRDPLSETTVTLEVRGVYSLPEPWVQKAEDGTDNSVFELKCCGFTMKAGKICPRELTEEEKKAEAEAVAQKGKVQSKIQGKKTGKEEKKEISPQEQEELARQAAEKEERERKQAEEWAKLNQEEKFYRTKENKFKTAWFEFDETERKQESARKEEEVVILQELVNDEHGVFLEFNKIPPAQEEPGAGAKKPGKGKAAAVSEAAQPVFGRAWIDFSALRAPGGNVVEGRFFIQTFQPTAATPQGTPEPQEATPTPVVPGEAQKLYEEAKTYVMVRFVLSEPINPPIANYPLAKPSDLVAHKPPRPKYPTGLDASELFRKQIALATESINHQFLKMFKDELEAQKKARPGEDKLKQSRESRRDRFLYDFNISNKYHVLKEKLKKTIVRIVKDKYQKSGMQAQNSIKGVTATERDQFYSELYAYLLEQMHASVDGVIASKRNQLHQELVVPHEQARIERDNILSKCADESLSQRNLRLSWEYEINGDLELSQKYLQDEINARNGEDIELWVQYSRFLLRHGRIEKAEECLRQAIALNEDENVEHYLMFSALMGTRGRNQEGCIFLKKILEKDLTHQRANLLIALLYERSERPGLSTKHIAIAKRKKMRDLGLLPPKGQTKAVEVTDRGLGRFEAGGSFPNPKTVQVQNETLLKQITLSPEHSNSLFLDLANFLLKENYYELAKAALSYVTDNTTVAFLLARAKVQFQEKAYSACTQTLNELLRIDSRHLEAWKLRGHAFYYLDAYFDCEESYIRAIRISGSQVDPELEERLGLIYIKRKSWKDAKVVFLKRVGEGISASSWKNLGLSLLKLNELSQAEEALTQANILDNLNAQVWGLLTIMCLQSGEKRIIQARQTIAEALKLGLTNPELLSEIGDLFSMTSDKEILGVECLNKAIECAGEKVDTGELWLKIANIKLTINDRNGAIDSYKQACREVQGSTNKLAIAQTLAQLLKGTDREAEMDEFRNILEEDGEGGIEESPPSQT